MQGADVDLAVEAWIGANPWEVILKLVIQIPAFNEVETLGQTLTDLPDELPGFDSIEYLVIDDGSGDKTAELAARAGAHHIVRHIGNRGLAQGFQTGLDSALAIGADIIVNTDADNQYDARDLEKLVRPIVEGKADIVIGDRQTQKDLALSRSKRLLQKAGSRIVSRLAGLDVPDAVSGFRAISRNAAQKLHILSDFSYTTEMLIQAGRFRLSVISVPIRTRKVDRPSRLFGSIPEFVAHSASTILRAYATYHPLRVFTIFGAAATVTGVIPIARFLYRYFTIGGEGHVQSLVLGGAFLVLGVLSAMLGVIADLIGRNRQLQEASLERLKKLEYEIAKDRTPEPERPRARPEETSET